MTVRSKSIFVCYRRSDSIDVVDRIYEVLAKGFPRQLFRDIDSIPIGLDFPSYITQTLEEYTPVVLVIIGQHWLDARSEYGYLRRLDDPKDHVRVEIETALRVNIRIIPVLVSNATMPTSEELPDSIQVLVQRSGVSVRPG